jgi:hypothetical protein
MPSEIHSTSKRWKRQQNKDSPYRVASAGETHTGVLASLNVASHTRCFSRKMGYFFQTKPCLRIFCRQPKLLLREKRQAHTVSNGRTMPARFIWWKKITLNGGHCGIFSMSLPGSDGEWTDYLARHSGSSSVRWETAALDLNVGLQHALRSRDCFGLNLWPRTRARFVWQRLFVTIGGQAKGSQRIILLDEDRYWSYICFTRALLPSQRRPMIFHTTLS